MNRWMLGLAIAGLLAAQSAITGDLEKLQGTWKIVSLDMEGQSVPVNMLNGASITVKGDQFTSAGMGGPYTGTVEVNSSTTPKQFQLKFMTGPEAGNTALGIYELDGDTWRICLSTYGTTRPASFAATRGTGFALEVLKWVPSQ